MSQRPAEQVLDESFLCVRAKILEIAATLDRIDRSSGQANSDRRKQIDQGIELLLGGAENRAEQVQMLFSREYLPEWQTDMNLQPNKTS